MLEITNQESIADSALSDSNETSLPQVGEKHVSPFAFCKGFFQKLLTRSVIKKRNFLR